jgi:hypothetical protein
MIRGEIDPGQLVQSKETRKRYRVIAQGKMTGPECWQPSVTYRSVDGEPEVYTRDEASFRSLFRRKTK